MDKITRKITRKIRHKIKILQDGYQEIVNHYNDKFNGEYVNILICKNGYEGESWEIDNKYCLDLLRLLKDIIFNGIIFDGKKYYIHGDLYFNNYYDSNFVKLITKEENEEIKKNYIFIENIVNKIVTERNKEYDTFYKKQNKLYYIRYHYIRDSNNLYNENIKLQHLAYHSIEAFEKSYKNLLKRSDFNMPYHRIVDYINDDEKDIIFGKP